MREFELIKKKFLPLSKKNKAANKLEDDVAKIAIGGNKDLILTKDLMVEDIHFNLCDNPYNIAAKLLLTNISDLASSGAKPLYYLLGFSQNNNTNIDFINNFCLGLKDISDQFKMALIGGDTVNAGDKLFFSVTAIGEIKQNRSLSRNRAKKGDLIFVSGFIGDALLGLKVKQKQINCPNKKYENYLVKRLLKPTPRIDLGINLVRKRLSKAAIDVSDGLVADLNHICQSSFLDAVIYEQKIPISIQAKYCLENNKNILMNDLMTGGDDYELIFTSSPKNRNKIKELSQELNVKITEIGVMENISKEPKIIILDKDKEIIKLSKTGYEHFII